jgi:hypothetical protein
LHEYQQEMAVEDSEPNVMDIADARFFKSVGLPLDKPIERKFFSEEYSRHWAGLMVAQIEMEDALSRCSGATTPIGWRKFKGRLRALQTEVLSCATFARRLWDDAATDDAREECTIMAHFLMERAVPYVTWWEKWVLAVEQTGEGGVPVEEIPPWIDSED